MKHFLTAIAVLFFSFSAQSQLTKGTWLVGGAGSFYSYDEAYTAPQIEVTGTYTGIDLSASFGYFLRNKLAGGLRPYFSSFKGEGSGGGSTNSYRLAIGPFVRYYLLKDDKQFNLLTDVSYQVGLNQRLGALHSSGKFNTLAILAGTEVFFNSAVGLEVLIGYKNQITSIEDSPDEYHSNKKGFQTSIGFTIHLENN